MRTYMALLKRNKQRLADAYAKHNAKLNGSKDTKDNLSAATSMSAANAAAPTTGPTVTVNAGGKITCTAALVLILPPALVMLTLALTLTLALALILAHTITRTRTRTRTLNRTPIRTRTLP